MEHLSGDEILLENVKGYEGFFNAQLFEQNIGYEFSEAHFRFHTEAEHKSRWDKNYPWEIFS